MVTYKLVIDHALGLLNASNTANEHLRISDAHGRDGTSAPQGSLSQRSSPRFCYMFLLAKIEETVVLRTIAEFQCVLEAEKPGVSVDLHCHSGLEYGREVWSAGAAMAGQRAAILQLQAGMRAGTPFVQPGRFLPDLSTFSCVRYWLLAASSGPAGVSSHTASKRTVLSAKRLHDSHSMLRSGANARRIVEPGEEVRLFLQMRMRHLAAVDSGQHQSNDFRASSAAAGRCRKFNTQQWQQHHSVWWSGTQHRVQQWCAKGVGGSGDDIAQTAVLGDGFRSEWHDV
ncbi:hypothetical protein JKP88DRAFT_246586 [Tribonema minus]|uniref:Uncharacterized protein n=1 Tax=Tribonema minus TaxID=303371 RepID=A0A835YWL3_9STRA|nr:hypothetical protein JKP88DRAFT_246586 [Tribonema minus]